MTRKLWGVTPTQSHNLAGRVVSMFRKNGLTHRPTLNRIHDIVETRSYDPWGLKLFLKNVVDLYTAQAPMPPATREQRVQYEPDRNAVLGGEQIVGMYEFDASPATDLGEHFSLPAYETEPDTYTHKEDL